PYLTTDYRLMLEKADDLLISIEILLRLFPNARAVIGIEDNKPQAIRHLQEAVQPYDRIEVCPLKTKYPQGGERMLIHAVTGADISSSVLPMDVGCVVENVASVLAIGDAVRFGVPLISRVMTLTGDALASPCNLRVAIGDSYRHVLEAAGGFETEPQKIISGGPMTGTAMFDLDVPVIKTSASLLALKMDDAAKQKTTACIHCGHCVRACPEFLVPQLLYRATQTDDFEGFEKLNGMECIECGCCAFACPAKLPLNQAFKYAKRVVGDRRRAQKAAETAKAAEEKAAAEAKKEEGGDPS
ncbi:MAG: RnfABCDGE type electron transport complex subunit C, partial [Clostridia bacterium]|nr:RnfABCDGE type electron transport complex subunit C [Clostridia bacterium]